MKVSGVVARKPRSLGKVKPLPLPPLSPTVCKFKAHKRCAVRSTNNCKWTTLASIGSDIIEDEEGVSGEAGVLAVKLSTPKR